MSLGLVVLHAAFRDSRAICAWSRKHFGLDAARRYSRLMSNAFKELQVDPRRIGVREHPDFPPDYLCYHLRHVDQGIQDAVQRPRHYVVFSVRARKLIIHRILHDSMDLPEHIT